MFGVRVIEGRHSEIGGRSCESWCSLVAEIEVCFYLVEYAMRLSYQYTWSRTQQGTHEPRFMLFVLLYFASLIYISFRIYRIIPVALVIIYASLGNLFTQIG